MSKYTDPATGSEFDVPGIILSADKCVMRTDSLIVEALLGQAEGLDAYSRGLQDERVRAQRLTNRRIALDIKLEEMRQKIVEDRDRDAAEIYATLYHSPEPQEDDGEDEALTRSEYIYRLLCSRNGDSIFGDRVLASDRYELYGARKETRNEPGDRSTRTVWAAYLRRLNEPPNEATDRYEVDDFLGKDFHIIEITADKVTVINERCGFEEVIPLNTSSLAEIGMVVEETEDSDDPYGNRFKAKEDWLEDALEDAHGEVIFKGTSTAGKLFRVYQDGTVALYKAADSGSGVALKYRWDAAEEGFRGHIAPEPGQPWTTSVSFKALSISEVEGNLKITLPDWVRAKLLAP